MDDREFLQWIHDRLKNVHGDHPSFDYMIKLRKIIHSMPEKSSCNSCKVPK